MNNKRVKEEKKTDQIHLIQKDETNSETLPSDTSKEPVTTIKDEAVQLDATDNCSKVLIYLFFGCNLVTPL